MNDARNAAGKDALFVTERAMSLRNVEQHQRKRELRQRLIGVIRKLAPRHRGKLQQILIDLSCKLDLSGPIDQTNLPVKPDGFTVKQTTLAKYPGVALSVICEFQVISMAVLYYWLYSGTGDPQDEWSCGHYCEWLEAYADSPIDYAVIQGEHMELYLYPLLGKPEDAPHLPEWLDDGETV